MKLITYDDYLKYIRKNNIVTIEDQVIKLKPIDVIRLEPQPHEMTDVSTTVWSFPIRGSWATHKGDYRGNWPPQMARALILKYTEPGNIVLDQMVGSGTTCIEARLLGRNCIGVDINYNAVILTLHRLYYLEKFAEKSINPVISLFRAPKEIVSNILSSWNKIYKGDARSLTEIKDNSIDLIATHPPYFNIIKYGGREREEGDLSKARDLETYLLWIREIAEESYRVLKPGKYCGILIGDTRINRHFIPISHYVLQMFLDAGFILKEEVIKIQHKMKTTRDVWNKLKKRDFLLIYHEKLLILRKPKRGEKTSKYKYSMKIDLNSILREFGSEKDKEHLSS